MSTISSKNNYTLMFFLVIGIILIAILLINTLNLVNINSLHISETIKVVKNDQQHNDERLKLFLTLNQVSGYNGIIHNFKNYILRKDDKYYQQVLIQHSEFSQYIKKLKQFLTKQELQVLTEFKQTIDAYKENIILAKTLAKRGGTTEEIDKRIKIDDTKAGKAINQLKLMFFSDMEKGHSLTEKKFLEFNNLLYSMKDLKFLIYILCAVVVLIILYLLYLFKKSEEH
ncbi:MAG: hypothetical protein HQL46_10460, partial [Gammaproteobacteria bacterium]|nr:hypothetical protein [Gammaproteobacteria bacterium]